MQNVIVDKVDLHHPGVKSKPCRLFVTTAFTGRGSCVLQVFFSFCQTHQKCLKKTVYRHGFMHVCLQIPCWGRFLLFHQCHSWPCSRWAALVENCTVIISHHHCVCRRHISFTLFLTDCHEMIPIEFGPKLNTLVRWKNKFTRPTPMNVQMPLLCQKIWTTVESGKPTCLRKVSDGKKNFPSDTVECLFLSTNAVIVVIKRFFF